MESLHAHASDIVRICVILGGIAVFVGMRDVLCAPALAAKRVLKAGPSDGGRAESVDMSAVPSERGSPVVAPDADRYRRGLTDYYRIQGGLKALAGLVLIIVSFVAR